MTLLGRRGHHRQARRWRAVRRADRLGDRRLHPRRGRRRADGGAGDGRAAARADRARAGPLDGGDDRVRRAARPVAASRVRPPTSTRPAASATRSRCRSRRWSRRAARPSRSCPDAGSGHTGGTLDKLESIPGWRAAVSNADFVRQLNDVGAVVCAAGDELAPADRKLYALRDVTGTVESIPLIASSIMSKKIAEGSHALVLDVKVGTGAFMKTLERARELAATMVGLGTAHGVRTRRAAHRHGHPARTHRRQRARGRRVGRGARRRRTGRRRRADPRAGPRDARRRGHRHRSRPTRCATAGRWTSGARMIAAQGGDPSAPLPTARREARRHRAGVRRAHPARRARRRHRGLAARRRAGAQGGRGLVRRRRGHARQAGRPGAARASRCSNCTPTTRPGSSARSTALDGGIEVGADYEPSPLVLDRIA